MFVFKQNCVKSVYALIILLLSVVFHVFGSPAEHKILSENEAETLKKYFSTYVLILIKLDPIKYNV